MRIGAIGYEPYVYRTNVISGKSLSPVNAIGQDLLASRTDFSSLSQDSAETIIPLKRGETANFADILAMQLQMGRMNAERIMRPMEFENGTETAGDSNQPEASLYQALRAAESYSASMNV